MFQILTKNICGEKLVFTNLRAVYWQREKCLIISDLHVGKTAHFRKYGIAVPSEILGNDLSRLELLFQNFEVSSLIIVGDFLHAGNNSDVDVFCEWRHQFPELKIILVKGNHDRFGQELAQKLCIDLIEDRLQISPFTFVHEPENSQNFSVSGHIHPGVVLNMQNVQYLKFPCFAVSENQLILPAFSEFTGLDCRSLDNNFVKFAISKDHIFEV